LEQFDGFTVGNLPPRPDGSAADLPDRSRGQSPPVERDARRLAFEPGAGVLVIVARLPRRIVQPVPRHARRGALDQLTARRHALPAVRAPYLGTPPERKDGQ